MDEWRELIKHEARHGLSPRAAKLPGRGDDGGLGLPEHGHEVPGLWWELMLERGAAERVSGLWVSLIIFLCDFILLNSHSPLINLGRFWSYFSL